MTTQEFAKEFQGATSKAGKLTILNEWLDGNKYVGNGVDHWKCYFEAQKEQRNANVARRKVGDLGFTLLTAAKALIAALEDGQDISLAAKDVRVAIAVIEA